MTVRRIITLLSALMLLQTTGLSAADPGKKGTVRDTTLYSDAYLDTVKVSRKFLINDYSFVGVQGGVCFNKMSFNPSYKQSTMFNPGYLSVTYTRYYKMFGLYPYFGMTIGLSAGHEGYEFKADKESGKIANIENATSATYDVIEIPFLMAGHVDTHFIKLMANAGIYGGYRYNITRSGGTVSDDIRNKFLDHDIRFDYGLQGGAGIGLCFDPVEIHFNGIVRYSWSSIYQPDYASKYYYRYAYPFDIMVTAGVYIHLTKRTGKTTRELKREALEIVKSGL